MSALMLRYEKRQERRAAIGDRLIQRDVAPCHVTTPIRDAFTLRRCHRVFAALPRHAATLMMLPLLLLPLLPYVICRRHIRRYNIIRYDITLFSDTAVIVLLRTLVTLLLY